MPNGKALKDMSDEDRQRLRERIRKEQKRMDGLWEAGFWPRKKTSGVTPSLTGTMT